MSLADRVISDYLDKNSRYFSDKVRLNLKINLMPPFQEMTVFQLSLLPHPCAHSLGPVPLPVSLSKLLSFS